MQTYVKSARVEASMAHLEIQEVVATGGVNYPAVASSLIEHLQSYTPVLYYSLRP